MEPLPLPAESSITERQIESARANLSFHVLEAGGTPEKKRPLILLLHGFPELAYSWRKVMPLLADANYYVVAVDQRGFGRTTGWDTSDFHKVDLSSFSLLRLVRDIIILVHALGYRSVKSVIGHDFGAAVAAVSALVRPDIFQSVVMMSVPFTGSPSLALGTSSASSSAALTIHKDLSELPNPSKHYKLYFSSSSANTDMLYPLESLPEFLRTYFHMKSADWEGNDPHPLKSWTAAELQKMPSYYIMPLGSGMREAVSAGKPSQSTLSQKSSIWLSDSDLAVYVEEFGRTGFQGGLNWYRCITDPKHLRDLDVFGGAPGMKIEVPSMFISGAKDWGMYQDPGALENFSAVCSDFHGTRVIEGAGHWVQQEQPESVAAALIVFLQSLA